MSGYTGRVATPKWTTADLAKIDEMVRVAARKRRILPMLQASDIEGLRSKVLEQLVMAGVSPSSDWRPVAKKKATNVVASYVRKLVRRSQAVMEVEKHDTSDPELLLDRRREMFAKLPRDIRAKLEAGELAWEDALRGYDGRTPRRTAARKRPTLFEECEAEFKEAFGIEWDEDRVIPLRALRTRDDLEESAAKVLAPLRRAIKAAREWATLHETENLLGDLGLALLRFNDRTRFVYIPDAKRSKNPGTGKVPRVAMLNLLDRYVLFGNGGRLLTARELAVVSLRLGNQAPGKTPAEQINAESRNFQKLITKSPIRKAWNAPE